jgi:3-oxoacyl-(acyl-carrier-protein) synthase
MIETNALMRMSDEASTGATGLRVLSRAHWPESPGDTATPIAGFIVSSFNPLVAEVAERCLRRRPGPPPAAARTTRTAILLASSGGDRATAQAIADAVRAGQRVAPLLFFQSNPNSILGHVAGRWGLAGPVVCISPLSRTDAGIPTEALSTAELLLRDGDADEVLVIAAEQGRTPDEPDRADAALVALAA